MAKKQKETVKATSDEQILNEVTEVKVEDTTTDERQGETLCMCTDTLLPVRSIEICNITELMSYEAASRLICGKYELTSRLDGVDNTKFKQFTDIHTLIMEEIERRVVRACELPKTI